MPETGDRRVTITDVAARAGVSKSAVSFVFNGRRGLSEATTSRILRAAHDLGWRPSARARALARNSPQNAGLVIRRDGQGTNAGSDLVSFLDGIGTALAATDSALVVRVVASRAAEMEVYAGFARESQVDGVVIAGLRIDDDRPAVLTRLGLPFVVADLVAATGQEWDGTRQAVRHLAAIGHRRIAIVAEDSLVRSIHRREAFADESHVLGLEAVVRSLSDTSSATVAAAVERLLESCTPPTAILFETAVLAVEGMRAARHRGTPVPERLSVVGLDDGPIALATDPAVTTVRRDAEAWGRACGRRLVSLIGGDDSLDVALPEAELVVRGSTGPPSHPLDHERSR